MKTKRIKNIKKYALAGVVLPNMPQLVPFNLTTAYKTLSNLAVPTKIKPQLFGSPATSGMSPDMIGGALQGVGELSSMIGGKSTATTGGEAVSQSVQDVFKGAGTGAKVGAAFGPVGAVVGGVAGAAIGLAGKKGEVTDNGPFEDPTMTLGTGITGAIKNKGIRKEYDKLKKIISGNRFARIEGANVQSEWDEEYDDNVMTMAKGGMIDHSLAYVDDGEMIKYPDGNIDMVPEQGQPTDSNLVNLPVGSKILSDTLKVPGTNKTFAEMGNKIMAKKSKGKDRFALNSDKLNLMNNDMIHEGLFQQQEILKNGKTKGNKFVKGGLTKMAPMFNNTQLSPDKISLNNISPETAENLRYKSMLINKKAIANGKISRLASMQDTVSKYTKGLGKIASTVGQLSPVISNLMSTPETFNTVTNPYESAIMSKMAKRKFNIDPAIRGIRENAAVSNYNASQYLPNTGANMAYRLQNAIATNKAITDIYSQKSNIDNQYAGDYANTLNTLGQQYVQARNMSTDLNARSRAAARNANAAGWSQLSNYLLNQELMSGQKSRDDAMLDLYGPFMEAGYKTSDWKLVLGKFRR